MDTGWKSPTSSGATWDLWTNGENAFTNDGQYAEVAEDGQYQSYEVFNLGIPAGAIIQGIELRCDAKATPGETDILISLVIPSRNLIATKQDTWEAVEQYYTLGSPTDPWNVWDSHRGVYTHWLATDFSNANFNIWLLSYGYPEDTWYLDHLQIKVYYMMSPLPTFRRP